jgi:creatinine amidohydrolase
MKFGELTAPQVAELDRDQTVVIVPIAAVEQHGPHLPTATDTIICTALAEAVEQQLPERVLLLPTFWLGASAHHLRFGGTLDAPLPHHIDILQDVCRSLLADGFQRLLILNGHGGNVDPLKVALRILQTDYPQALLVGGSYWSTAADLLEQTLEGEHRFVGHACEFETSMILHLRPELVQRDKTADAGPLIDDQLQGLFIARDMFQRTAQGCTGRPDLATAEKGATLFRGITARLCQTVTAMLQQPLATDYPEFLI